MIIISFPCRQSILVIGYVQYCWRLVDKIQSQEERKGQMHVIHDVDVEVILELCHRYVTWILALDTCTLPSAMTKGVGAPGVESRLSLFLDSSSTVCAASG